MKWLVCLFFSVFFCFSAEGALQQWVLEYTGYCDTNVTDSFRKCYGKAGSEDMTSNIDAETGVDFSITDTKIGPVSELFIIEIYSSSNTFSAVGNMTFGTYQNTHTTLSISFSNDDIDTYYDDNGDYASIGKATINSGSGPWAKASGQLTMNTISQQNSEKKNELDWTAIIVGNIVD